MTPQSWQVYLVRCADDSLYCGVTTDMERRLAQHNGLRSGGARYTRSRRPVRLEASRTCTSLSEALRLEALVKRTPRARKHLLLQSADL
ncbi:GIY-YIG nuclease family protein [uncultured Desulfovibrio sp.]|uniref:GIY-YIG nuclease family protein n=1 Tax=Candidatus Desulfovibrio intestinavium TaxID=2838534 RepID=A0A9D2HP32_9BACT|nr:GIY-YIG nuclease family protein [uncultured Desulfovibrio sp.]HJA79344.1 GIY-YIG nuclease family protein [Candidatus Desulfovibrio intestinavium]